MYFQYNPHRYAAFRSRIVPEKVVACFFLGMNNIVSLNKYIQLERHSRFAAAASKKRLQAALIKKIGEQKIPHIVGGPFHIHLCWAIHNRRSDMDNIAWAKKYVVDALVAADVFSGDGMKHIESYSDDYELVPTDKQGVWIEVIAPLTIEETLTYGSNSKEIKRALRGEDKHKRSNTGARKPTRRRGDTNILID